MLSSRHAPYNLSEILNPERLEVNLYRGVSPSVGWQRVFGGQVVAQALSAANHTVESWSAHSLHGYFIRPGDPAVPILYEVEALRDGRSFATRRVTAIQHGKSIFAMILSYQAEEAGLTHQIPMPEVPPPEACRPDSEPNFLENAPQSVRSYFRRPKPIDFRVPLEPREGQSPLHLGVWIKVTEDIAPDVRFHQAVLAYLSDLTPLDTALAAHGLSVFDATVQAASLDHALWFHRPVNANDWHLFVQDSPSTSGGRGLTLGRIYHRDGTLVASVAQEGLMRPLVTRE